MSSQGKIITFRIENQNKFSVLTANWNIGLDSINLQHQICRRIGLQRRVESVASNCSSSHRCSANEVFCEEMARWYYSSTKSTYLSHKCSQVLRIAERIIRQFQLTDINDFLICSNCAYIDWYNFENSGIFSLLSVVSFSVPPRAVSNFLASVGLVCNAFNLVYKMFIKYH